VGVHPAPWAARRVAAGRRSQKRTTCACSIRPHRPSSPDDRSLAVSGPASRSSLGQEVRESKGDDAKEGTAVSPPRRPLIVGLVLITGLIGVGVAEAAYTSEQHDGTPKYYNSRVAYTDNGSTIDIDQREFKGGRDGGAIKWRQESIKDYVNDVEQESVGYGSWAYNIALSSWYYYPSESHPTYTQTVEIRYVFKYQEWTEEEGYYYWFAGDLGNIEHTITP
jgi:hypothetical protein